MPTAIIRRVPVTTFFNVSDVAKATGISVKTLWSRINTYKTLAAPTHQVGKGPRFYYSESEFRQIVADLLPITSTE